MEAIAETKRKETNIRILTKKAADVDESLLEYSDRVNGEIFEHNTAGDVIQSMFTKGKTPLRMAPMCQPALAPPGHNILWESNCVRIKAVPLLHRESKSRLFEAIKPTSALTIRDALQVLSLGGVAYWKDPRKKLFSKEKTVFAEFSFYDPDNFLCIYEDSFGLKRIMSIPASALFDSKHPNVETREIECGTDILRFHDETFFSAVCLLLCHGQLITRIRSQSTRRNSHL
jgi:hypothetical protein